MERNVHKSKASLSTLPLELFLEIVERASLLSKLNLSMTCKSFGNLLDPFFPRTFVFPNEVEHSVLGQCNILSNPEWRIPPEVYGEYNQLTHLPLHLGLYTLCTSRKLASYIEYAIIDGHSVDDHVFDYGGHDYAPEHREILDSWSAENQLPPLGMQALASLNLGNEELDEWTTSLQEGRCASQTAAILALCPNLKIIQAISVGRACSRWAIERLGSVPAHKQKAFQNLRAVITDSHDTNSESFRMLYAFMFFPSIRFVGKAETVPQRWEEANRLKSRISSFQPSSSFSQVTHLLLDGPLCCTSSLSLESIIDTIANLEVFEYQNGMPFVPRFSLNVRRLAKGLQPIKPTLRKLTILAPNLGDLGQVGFLADFPRLEYIHVSESLLLGKGEPRLFKYTLPPSLRFLRLDCVHSVGYRRWGHNVVSSLLELLAAKRQHTPLLETLQLSGCDTEFARWDEIRESIRRATSTPGWCTMHITKDKLDVLETRCIETGIAFSWDDKCPDPGVTRSNFPYA